MRSRPTQQGVLVISNLYPPHYFGGYELACAEVVEALRGRGWDVQVLTSRYPAPRPTAQPGMERSLYFHLPGFSSAIQPAREFLHFVLNRAMLRRSLAHHRPEIVLAFNLSGLGALLLDLLHRQPLPVVHDISDTSLAAVFAYDAWFNRIARPRPDLHRRLSRWLVRTVGGLVPRTPTSLDLGDSFFRSDYLRRYFQQVGFPVASAPVIHHGIPESLLARQSDPMTGHGVVFSGRLSPEKGVTILVRAMALASPRLAAEHRHLSMVGPLTDPGYKSELERAIREAADSCLIELLPQVTRDQSQRLLPEHAVFAFPVLWDEPFSIALLEALALGMPVVATITGGTSEILEDGRNCLAFPAGDAEALAEALVRLLGDDALRRALGSAARQSASVHTIGHAIDAIESHLLRTVESATFQAGT